MSDEKSAGEDSVSSEGGIAIVVSAIVRMSRNAFDVESKAEVATASCSYVRE